MNKTLEQMLEKCPIKATSIMLDMNRLGKELNSLPTNIEKANYWNKRKIELLETYKGVIEGKKQLIDLYCYFNKK